MKAIPYDQALAICEETRAQNRGKWYTFNGMWCWGCATFTKGNPSGRCFASSADNRGCAQVNQRFDQRATTKSPGYVQPARPVPPGRIAPPPQETPHPSGDQPPVSTSLPETDPPVVVRGDAWKNTAEKRWPAPKRMTEADFSSIDGLIKGLDPRNTGQVRLASAEGLGRLGAKASQAIPPLIKAAVDIDGNVRKAALNSLKAIDPNWEKNRKALEAVPFLFHAVGSYSKEVSTAAPNLLVQMGKKIVPFVVEALKADQDTIAQYELLVILNRIGPDAASAVPQINRALKSQYKNVRLAALRALTTIGPDLKTSLPLLMVCLSDAYPDVKEAAAQCLLSLGAASEPATPALILALADRDMKVRDVAAAAIEKIGPKTIPTLTELLIAHDMHLVKTYIKQVMLFSDIYKSLFADNALWKDTVETWNNVAWVVYEAEDQLMRIEDAHCKAIQILGRFGPAAASAAPVIGKLLATGKSVTLAALYTLAAIGTQDRDILVKIVPLLIHSDAEIRAEALATLERINSDWRTWPEVVPLIPDLGKNLNNRDTPGEIAVQALAIMGRRAVPFLIKALASENEVVRKQAADTLGQIGPEAQEAIPALVRLLADPSSQVREAAAKALEKIRKGDPT